MFLEGVAKFKYLRKTLTDQNCMQEEIKSRLNSENACYHLVQCFLSSHLLSRNVKVKIYEIISLPFVLFGFTLREEHRLRVFENKVVRRIFGLKSDELTGEWRKLHDEELHILYSSPNIIRQIKSRRMRWAGHVVHMGEERNVYNVLRESQKERDHLEDQGIDGRMGSEWILGRLARGV
jgi:hypothetical protein